MEAIKKRDIVRIRKLLKEGNSELGMNAKCGYLEIYGYVSMQSILLIIKEGYHVYHSKLNDSAMMVCKK